MKLQRSNQLVYLHDFADAAYTYEGLYPQGAREKKALTAPTTVPYDFLINGHSYLFKKSFKRYPHQFWIEIAAYRLGCLMGVPVPPAFIAYDPITLEFGALIEWFYGYPSSLKQAYNDGGVYMMHLIDNYDMKTGNQHNFYSISMLMKAFQRLKLFNEPWEHSWAKIFTFDSITGNTDRHHDNWGIVWTYEDATTGKLSARLAPAFDNGTSLGHEIIDRNIHKFSDRGTINRYILRGTHHAKWHIDDKDRSSHSAFIKKFIFKYPESLKVILECLKFDSQELVKAFYELIEFDVLVPLTEERVAFMIELVETRRKALLEILEV